MGTNWFMPALVKSRFGESGMRLEEGTMVCDFDLKKSRYDWRMSLLVITIDQSGMGIITGGKASARFEIWDFDWPRRSTKAAKKGKGILTAKYTKYAKWEGKI